MVLARGFVKQEELAKAIDEIRPELDPDIVQLTYALGEDWSGDPAIFFRIVLADPAGQRLAKGGTLQFKLPIIYKLKLLEEWGLLPYFAFRTESENERSANKGWPDLG
jgi:hypothetical protein